MIPGVQKPHWEPPVATKASAHAAPTSSPNPASVVTARPATRVAGVTHETRASPSTSTVQQPHCPWGAQPSLTVVIPNRSRKTESRDSPSVMSSSTGVPSSVNARSVS